MSKISQNTGLKIILIEDDPLFAELVCFALQRDGNNTVQHFENGQECLVQLEEQPDLFIVDQGLPGIIGQDLIKVLERQCPSAHFIMLSGQEKVQVAIDQMKRGHEYLQKNESAFEQLDLLINKIRVQKEQKNFTKETDSFLNRGLKKISHWMPMLLLTVILFLSSGCKNYNYFQESSAVEENAPELFENHKKAERDYAVASLEEAPPENSSSVQNQIRLKVDHKISISIWGHDELSVGSLFSVYSSNEVYGKWIMIPSSGQVELPQLGPISIAGKTVEEAQKLLKERYEEIIVDPLVVIKIHNREITVLGEVLEPGKILLEKERYNISDILALAGGTSFFADTRELRLMRTINGETIDYPINLTKMSAVQQHQLIMQEGDVLYVPSQKSQNMVRKSPVLIPLSGAITTILLLIQVL